MSPEPKGRGLIFWILTLILVPVLLVGGLAGGLVLLRPYWDLQGNFFPTFDFESKSAHDEKIEESRELQRETRSAVAETRFAALDPLSSWPRYRGANADGLYLQSGLLDPWPAEGPLELYRQPIGGGYAGFVIGSGRAYTIEQRREEETVVCYDFETGYEIWSFGYRAYFQEQMGGDGPRSTPTLGEGRLYALGAQGDFHCLDAATGRLIWATNILEGMENLEWGMSGAPLILGDLVVVANSGFGGDSILAFDKATGEAAWSTLRQRQAFTSLMVADLAGRRQIVNMSAGSLNGIDAETREVLWSHPWTTTNGINCAQPILAGDDRIFVSSGYGHGCALLKISAEGEGFTVTELWRNANMKNKFNSSVIYKGYIYGLDEGVLACLELETGRKMWKAGRYGHGQLIVADGKLIVLGEMGDLSLVKASPAGHEVISKVSVLKGKTWNYPAIADGRLLVRNSKEMVCLDLRDPSPSPSEIIKQGGSFEYDALDTSPETVNLQPNKDNENGNIKLPDSNL